MKKQGAWKYKILLFFVKLISWLPLWFFYILSDCLYLIAYYIVGYRKKVVTQNLKTSFPEKPEAEIKKIRKQFYHNFCDWLMESIKGQTMSTKNIQKRMKVVSGMDILYGLIDKKRSVITINAHQFNWEWLAIMQTYYPPGTKSFAVYQPAKNKVFTDLQNRMRDQFGNTSFPMSETLQVITRNHKQGESVVYLFFADQAPPRTNLFWTTFLNQEAAFFLGGEKIASKFDYGVVYLDIDKPRRGYYEISVKLISDNARQTDKYEITRSYVRLLEEHIRKHPANWLWSHRRWKHTRPEGIPLTAI